MLWRKATRVQSLVLDHLACVRKAIDFFLESTNAYFTHEDEAEAKRLALETHRAEGQADDIRREAERTLIGGALLASSRRHVLEIIERVDTLANAAEATLDYLLVQHVDIPEEIKPTLLQMVDETGKIFGDVECGIRALLQGDRKETLACTERIETREGTIDQFERDAVKKLFRLDIGLSHKLHVAGYLDGLVEISDRAEDLSDRIVMVVAERAF